MILPRGFFACFTNKKQTMHV